MTGSFSNRAFKLSIRTGPSAATVLCCTVFCQPPPHSLARVATHLQTYSPHHIYEATADHAAVYATQVVGICLALLSLSPSWGEVVQKQQLLALGASPNAADVVTPILLGQVS